MTVLCVKCQAKLAVPDDKARPELKLKCPGCGLVFPLGKARVAGSARRAVAPGPTESTAAKSTKVGGPAGGAASPAAGARSATDWRRCANHPNAASVVVCESCDRGYCPECGKRVQSATICPTCETLCTKVKDREEKLARAKRRAKPLRDEIETIAKYPFGDLIAYFMLALMVGVLGMLGSFSTMLLRAIRNSVLMWYAFHTVARVANGELKLSIPEFRDTDDLWRPFKLGVAASLAAHWPFIAFFMLGSGLFFASSGPLDMPGLPQVAVVAAHTVAHTAQFGDSESANFTIFGMTIGVFLLVSACLMYSILVTPVALMVAATTRSFMATINPKVALSVIAVLGASYGEVLLIYGLIAGPQFLITAALTRIPLAGAFLVGFVDAYAYLAIGCLLGLVVDKNSEKLGFD